MSKKDTFVDPLLLMNKAVDEHEAEILEPAFFWSFLLQGFATWIFEVL